jgi:hypothetical protein
MWVNAILREVNAILRDINSEVKIHNAFTQNWQYIRYWAEIIWVLSNLRVENITSTVINT